MTKTRWNGRRAVAAGLVCVGLLATLAAARDIFVPPPRPDDPIDGAGAGTGGDSLDRVVAKSGDVVLGRVVEIADGRVRLTGAQFDGDVKMMLAGLDQITLVPGKVTGGRDSLTLANGDAIMGEVTGITADEVAITSDCAGPVKVPRRVVSAIGFGKGSGILVDCDFSRSLEPWKSIRGAWNTAGGVAVCNAQGDYAILSAAIAQSKPVTMEAVVEPTNGYSLYCTMVLCCDISDNSNYLGRNSAWVTFSSSNFSIGYSKDGGTNNVNNRNMRQVNSGETATVRAAYDPDAKKMKVWINGASLGEADVPMGPAAGKCVLFCTQYPCKVKSLRVLPGLVGPTETGGAPKDDGDLVYLGNKDNVSAKGIALAEGQVVLTTSYGELKSAVDKVDRIVFNPKNIERPRRQKGDVLVETTTSKFTLQIDSLTNDGLVGSSDSLGKVTIKRAALRSLRFSLYERPAAGPGGPPSSVAPNPPPMQLIRD